MRIFAAKFWDTLKFMGWLMTHRHTEQELKDRIGSIRRKWGLETW